MKDICAENYNQKVLAEIWDDFIDYKKRRKGENGFLVRTLRKFKVEKVFDSAMGNGVDSIHLLKNGFDVTSNEIDKPITSCAKQNARKQKVRLKITSFDWRELEKHFAPNSFDAIICLGNSLTYLFTKESQLKALKNFCHCLKKGGILVIDERNYQYFLDKRTEILAGKFRYSGKYVYCGRQVHGEPVEISGKRVKMKYTDGRTGKTCHLILYPFKKNELAGLLKEAGFRKVERFSDYKKGFSQKADFYTYVCVK